MPFAAAAAATTRQSRLLLRRLCCCGMPPKLLASLCLHIKLPPSVCSPSSPCSPPHPPLRSHFLAFKKPSYNKLLALFGNLPLVVPVAKKFREYHHDHHIFLVRPGLGVEMDWLWMEGSWKSCMCRVGGWQSARTGLRLGAVVYTLPPLPPLACRALTAATSTCPPCSSPTGSPASSPRWGAAALPAVAAVWLGHRELAALQLCVCLNQTCQQSNTAARQQQFQQPLHQGTPPLHQGTPPLHQGTPSDRPPSPLPPLQLFFTFIYLSIYAVRPLVVRPKAVSESGGRRLGCAGPTSGVDSQRVAATCSCLPLRAPGGVTS